MKTKKKSVKYSALDLREKFLSGELSVSSHLSKYLQRIEEKSSANAFLQVLTDELKDDIVEKIDDLEQNK